MNTPTVALTIRQPWAALVLAEIKRFEARTWWTDVRASIFVHVGVNVDHDAPDEAWDLVGDLGAVRGVIAGVATIADVIDGNRARPWAPAAEYHWRLSHVVPLETPVAARGNYGLWVPPEDVSRAVRAQLPPRRRPDRSRRTSR